MRVLYPGQIGIWSVFVKGGKTGEPGEKPSEEVRVPIATRNSTHI